MSNVISIHAIIRGRVQGVGYRNWTAREAKKRGLHGWVRNRADGSVEAVFTGSKAAVEEMLAACRKGPLMAKVSEILTTEADTETEAFEVRATA